MNLDVLRLEEKRTELAHLRARCALLEAEIAEARASTPVSTPSGSRVYDPSWKLPGRPHLSPAGEKAILAAFEDGMSQSEVSRLFTITEKAAGNWQQRWQATRNTDRTT